MTPFEKIFGKHEPAFTKALVFSLLLFPEFQKQFIFLLHRKINFDLKGWGLEAIHAEKKLLNGKKPDIILTFRNNKQRKRVLIENKITARIGDNGKQLINYQEDMREGDCLLLLCPKKYYKKNKATMMAPMVTSIITYTDLVDIINNNDGFLSNDFFQHFKQYLEQIEMGNFAGFNSDSTIHYLNNYKTFNQNEAAFKKDLRAALDDIFYNELGDLYFEDLEIIDLNDRGDLKRPDRIGDMGYIVKYRNLADLKIWVTLVYNEINIKLVIYLFFPNGPLAEKIHIELCKQIPDEKSRPAKWNNQISFRTKNFSLSELFAGEWGATKEYFRSFIREKISYFPVVGEKMLDNQIANHITAGSEL